MKPVIIIAAIASRAYVQAATNAGFKVIAIDAFADFDTQKSAFSVYQCVIKDGQFDAEDFLTQLHKIDLSHSLGGFLGLCFGAGFEAQPALLMQISKHLPIIGNTAQTVELCKNPQAFFAFCDAHTMPHPDTQFERPTTTLSWLEKRIGGSGGMHIKPLLPLDYSLKSQKDLQLYYQKAQAGTPISCLFLADGKYAQVIGFNEQWCSATPLLPYRFGGVVSCAELSDAVKTTITHFIETCVAEIGLKGLNSIDFLLHKEQLFALEINPRLSASLDCYRAQKGDLFAAHVATCLGNLQEWPDNWPIVEKQARAQQIVYANKLAQVPPEMDWPDWVCDIPQANTQIAAGEPLCTIVATARTAKLAKQKVLQRLADL